MEFDIYYILCIRPVNAGEQSSTMPSTTDSKAQANLSVGTQAKTSNWWDAFPVAQSSAPNITVQELASMMKDETKHDYAVIDVRRNDHDVRWFLFLRSSSAHCASRGAMCEEAHKFRRRHFMTIFLTSSRNMVRQSRSSFTA